MRDRLRSFALGSALAASMISTVACAHAPTRSESQVRELGWALVLARYMARSTEPAILFADPEQAQSRLDDLQANERILFALVRTAEGKELGHWGTLPAGCELPATGPAELRQARAGRGVVRVPVLSSYTPGEFLGDLVLVVRTEAVTEDVQVASAR